MIKNKKVRALLFTLTLAFFAVGTIAIAKEVMKKEVASVKQTPTTYYYNGPANNPAVDVINPAYWSTTQATGFSCGHETDIPCSLSVPVGETITSVLDDLGDFNAVKEATKNNRRNKNP